MAIAIIGAGMAGLACADQLQSAHYNMTLFDKGRGPGGRMSTRRAQTPAGMISFDHGAQYFTARHPGFQSMVKQWQADNAVAPWPAAGADAFVGTPGNNAPIRAMAHNHNVKWGTRVERLERYSDGWAIMGEERDDQRYSHIIIAVPAEQVSALLTPHHRQFASKAAAVQSAPCWTIMLAFDRTLPIDADILRNIGPIRWAARNCAKPGRTATESWVIQADPQWSMDHLEEQNEDVLTKLSSIFADKMGLTLPEPLVAMAHRWRYAMVPRPSEAQPYLYDRTLQLGLCGDWLSGPRVENAYLSGQALARAIIG